MKITCPFIRRLSLVLPVAALVAFSGCDKKTSTEPGKPATESPKAAAEKAGASGKLASAEKNSFDEVTSQLDAGGNFYLYLSTEQWTRGISDRANSFKDMIGSIPDIKDEDRVNVEKGFSVITRLIKDSGIEDVSGVGMSSIAREPGVYRTKALLHHYQGQGNGFLWNMFGNKPHALTGLDLLPTNTVFASFSDVDVAMMWATIQKEAKQSGFPQADEFLKELPENFEKKTGVKWDKLVSSLGGEFGFAVTFDESKQIPIPLPSDEPLQVPEPALMIVIKVTDDTIFNRVDQAIKEMGQQPVTVDEPALKMRTVPLPLPLPIQLRPTMASSGGYLLISTTDELVRHALAVKSGKEPGLKSTAEFTRVSAGLPTEGNQFLYVSPRLGQKIIEIQRQALKMNKDAPDSAKKMIQGWMDPNRAGFVYSIASRSSTGWVITGNSSHSAGPLVMATAVAAPVGFLAAIAIPNFTKARGTAQKNACINNLRQLDSAKAQWALENKKKDTDTPEESDLAPYLAKSKMLTCPGGGSYTINAVGQKPECSQPGHALSE